MILIDALHINVGGGKTLLSYLISKLESENLDVYYLLDERMRNKQTLASDKVTYLKAGLNSRRNFYRNHRRSFSKIFCLANLPPSIKLESEVITYFQNSLYLNYPKEVSCLERMKLSTKRFVLNSYKNYTNYWFVQSQLIKKGLINKFKIPADSIKILPFYPPYEMNKKIFKNKNTFFYASGGASYKNHERLIEAFCLFYDKYKVGQLVLTIASNFSKLIQIINEKTRQNYPIKNLGFIKRDYLEKIYQESEFLIFPSLTESFGLGLVEAIESGCKVIGADLPYTYAVCEPSIVFNPLDINDIVRALEDSQKENIKPTIQVAFNQIDDLIQILKQ